eukprot:14545709-Ditylum_brightwellii.AAC.3
MMKKDGAKEFIAKADQWAWKQLGDVDTDKKGVKQLMKDLLVLEKFAQSDEPPLRLMQGLEK